MPPDNGTLYELLIKLKEYPLPEEFFIALSEMIAGSPEKMKKLFPAHYLLLKDEDALKIFVKIACTLRVSNVNKCYNTCTRIIEETDEMVASDNDLDRPYDIMDKFSELKLLEKRGYNKGLFNENHHLKKNNRLKSKKILTGMVIFIIENTFFKTTFEDKPVTRKAMIDYCIKRYGVVGFEEMRFREECLELARQFFYEIRDWEKYPYKLKKNQKF